MIPIQIVKEAGYTMNQTIYKYKKENNITDKVCYCGRLDPMARGLVYLLVGNNCKYMEDYNKFKKEYVFEIVFGISTDTDDPLGKIINTSFINKDKIDIDIDKIKNYINNYINKGPFEQKYHNYSSKRINGIPLWNYKKNNIDMPNNNYYHNVEILGVEIDNIKTYNFNDWRENIISTINKIDKKNDFRQNEIIDDYNKLNFQENLYSLVIKINVTSGFYVRQLVSDIKDYLNIPILTYDINRTKLYK
jgi:tRNA pseudouridine(55) synthase